jgi:hypothetical protein
MGAVLTQTYRHSKLTYLYFSASMFFLASFFMMVSNILFHWTYGCGLYWADNPKCPGYGKPSEVWSANMKLMVNTTMVMGQCFLYLGHWLFAFRYFEVAEMFGRKDKTVEMHEKRRRYTTCFSYFGVVVIVLNYLLYYAFSGIT